MRTRLGWMSFAGLFAYLLFRAHAVLAAEVPVYSAVLRIDCRAQQSEFMTTTHPIVGELRFLLGRETEAIRLISGRFDKERVPATNNVVSFGREPFAITTMLEKSEGRRYDLLLRSTIEIRKHSRFCEIVQSGIELSLYTGELLAVNLIFSSGKYFEGGTELHRNAVKPANDEYRRAVINLIGKKYFNSLKRLFSNHFRHFLNWQSGLEIDYDYARPNPNGLGPKIEYDDNAEGIDTYMAFYEHVKLYNFIVGDDPREFRLSDAPFEIDFSENGDWMYWTKGNHSEVCFEVLDGDIQLSNWFCGAKQ